MSQIGYPFLTCWREDAGLGVAGAQLPFPLQLQAAVSIPGKGLIQEAVEEKLQPPGHHQAHLQAFEPPQ